MAAYASLLSLGHILHQLLEHPPRQMAVLDKAQIDSLLENITFLQEFLEDFSLTRGDEIEALEEKITRLAYAAEDIIESRVVDQILENAKVGSKRSRTLFRQDLQIFRNSNTKSRRRGMFRHFKLLLKKMTTLPNVSRSSALFSRNIIESREVGQILDDSEAGRERSRSTLFCPDLHKVIEEFGSLKKDVMKIKETEGIKIVQQPKKDVTAGSFVRGVSDSKDTMVGFDDDLIQIMEILTGDESNLQILSIVGMGGIGKTTLAKNVFNNPLIVRHFDLSAWVTISQQYSVRQILLGLLKDIGVLAGGGEEITQRNDDELGLRLYRSLFERRYLIVMDDMWIIEVWDAIKRFFPDNNNGSRVMVTTRLSNVADNFGSCTPHHLQILDPDQSWALFCDKVFGKETSHPELEEIGKTIVRNCRGLPLAIVAISGLLAKSSRTIEYWEHIANDTYAALNMGGDELCFEVLSLSYKYLPIHLKPCFLYMAIFPEDRIKVSRLVKLWVAEAILKPMRHRSLEEIAYDNLKDLIDRNLIQVRDYGSRNKIKTCTIHDLLRDLCLREAQREKFLCVTTIHGLNSHPRSTNSTRLIIQHGSCKEKCKKRVFDAIDPSSRTRSLVCRELNSTSMELPFSFRLLRVLWMEETDSYEKIPQVVNLRFIEFEAQWNTNPWKGLESLSVLWNLQSIRIVGTWSTKSANLPAEIWEMPQLRHLKIDGVFHLPDPPSTKSKNGIQDFLVLKNLQTLYKIRNVRCLDEVIHRIPNLKKLGVSNIFQGDYGWKWDHEVKNLVHLCNLESLLLERGKVVLQNICFPHSLKKLTLSHCIGVYWKDLTVVGLLPNLEVLKLMGDAVSGREWNPVEGEFVELKFLQIQGTTLEEWTAERDHFPRLENLTLAFVEHLKEIPYGIGEIPTLRSISLLDCSESVESSAKKIQAEQQSLGNYGLKVVHNSIISVAASLSSCVIM